jgi:mono/diheme cytochrome c family protein
VSVIATKPAGRDYLMQVILNGMAGTVTVDKQTIIGGVMPDFATLPDADLAAILTYVAGLKGGAAAPFGAGDLKLARAKPVGNTAMLRKTLVAAKVVP